MARFSGGSTWDATSAGAHYTPFIVYDLDGDGLAEVACRTADGTVDGTGKTIGNADADCRNAKGYVLDGPEFLAECKPEVDAKSRTFSAVRCSIRHRRIE